MSQFILQLSKMCGVEHCILAKMANVWQNYIYIGKIKIKNTIIYGLFDCFSPNTATFCVHFEQRKTNRQQKITSQTTGIKNRAKQKQEKE